MRFGSERQEQAGAGSVRSSLRELHWPRIDDDKEIIAAGAHFEPRASPRWRGSYLAGEAFLVGLQQSKLRCRYSRRSELREKRISDTEQFGSLRPVAAEFIAF